MVRTRGWSWSKRTNECNEKNLSCSGRLHLWPSGQTSWLQIQRSRFRFPALPNFLRSSGSGMESTQSREDNWGGISRKWRLRSRKQKLTSVGESLLWPCDILYPLKLALTSPPNGDCSVGIVRWGTKAPEFFSCVQGSKDSVIPSSMTSQKTRPTSIKKIFQFEELSVYYDITLFSSLKVKGRFRGTYDLHLQGWRRSISGKQYVAASRSIT
jgi:hypothetical protein